MSEIRADTVYTPKAGDIVVLRIDKDWWASGLMDLGARLEIIREGVAPARAMVLGPTDTFDVIRPLEQDRAVIADALEALVDQIPGALPGFWIKTPDAVARAIEHLRTPPQVRPDPEGRTAPD